MYKDVLLIIRHARSDWNIRVTDKLDSDITEFGQRQSKKVGEFLLNHLHKEGVNYKDLDKFTSPFLRCLQTTAGIEKGYGQKAGFRIEPLLREYLNHQKKHCFVPHRETEFNDFGWSQYPAEGITFEMEQNEDFLRRMHMCFHKLPPKSLVVTHGLPGLALLRIAANPGLSDVPVYDYSLDNCSMSLIVRGRVVWHGRNVYHEIDHDPFDKYV